MKELVVTEFIDKLGSSEPTPGGGAAAGVTAGLGIGAVLMALKFSTNKKMSDADKEFLLMKIEEFEKSKELFKKLIDRDATDFGPLSEAYSMPKTTDEEKQARQEAIEEGLKIASQPPIELLKEVEKITEDLYKLVPLTKKIIISDLGVGAQMLRSAVHASSLNLAINAGQLKEEAVKKEYKALSTTTVEQVSIKLDQVYKDVQDILN